MDQAHGELISDVRASVIVLIHPLGVERRLSLVVQEQSDWSCQCCVARIVSTLQ